MTKQIDELMALATEYARAMAYDGATHIHRDKLRSALEAALKPGGEPVAEIIADEDGYAFIKWHGDESRFHEIHPIGTKFYTAPPAQTPPPLLTDDEIGSVLESPADVRWLIEADPISRYRMFARAIESAVRKQWAEQFGVQE